MPARPRSPRDKAKVEVGVQIAERWLLARIRNETFTSLGALNARLFELTADLNSRPMRTYKASRRELFERFDKPALAPLPAQPFEASTWKKVALNIDYHLEFDHHLYSASHALLREELWVRATASTVEILHGDTSRWAFVPPASERARSPAMRSLFIGHRRSLATHRSRGRLAGHP
jgi:Mu transposase-like protein